MRRAFSPALLSAGALTLLASGVWGDPETWDPDPVFPAVRDLHAHATILIGYSMSDRESHQKDMASIPMAVRIPLWHKDQCPWIGDLDLFSELQGGVYAEPRSQLEVGLPLCLRYSLPVRDSFLAFLDVGVGPTISTFHAKSLGGHFNFIDQAGIGLRFPLDKATDLELCYRFRHVSNAGLDTPDRGIESHTFLIGTTFRY